MYANVVLKVPPQFNNVIMQFRCGSSAPFQSDAIENGIFEAAIEANEVFCIFLPFALGANRKKGSIAWICP